MRRAAFLALVFALCSAEGCPSRCESQSDCGSGYHCAEAQSDDGQYRKFCFSDDPERAQKAAKGWGWSCNEVTVGTSGASMNCKKD